MKCEICGKAASFGNNVSHSKRHTRRNWLPNIQPKMVLINGTKRESTFAPVAYATNKNRRLIIQQPPCSGDSFLNPFWGSATVAFPGS